MDAAVIQNLNRLDKVDPELKNFFADPARKLLKDADLVNTLAAALACMSGFLEVPQDRSLLTQVCLLKYKTRLIFSVPTSLASAIVGCLNTLATSLACKSGFLDSSLR